MRLDSASLAVLGDSREERGLGRAPLWLVEERAYANAVEERAYANATADATADADANAYSYVYTYANADADAYADDSDAYALVYADADAYADALADDYQRSITMQSGLYAVSLSQSGRTVLRVGWFRRDTSDPDEYETVWVTPYRGEYTTRLGDVWAAGPKAAPNWTWGKPVPSVAHRIHFHPLARLDPEAWAAVCPKPEGW